MTVASYQWLAGMLLTGIEPDQMHSNEANDTCKLEPESDKFCHLFGSVYTSVSENCSSQVCLHTELRKYSAF